MKDKIEKGKHGKKEREKREKVGRERGEKK